MKPAPGSLPPVLARAVVETSGAREERTVQMYGTLPGWWNKSTEDQRRLWLTEYFRKQLQLSSEQVLVSVTCP
jgi:hypothetical protein